jgi:arylsulfatase A-like enzyme
MKKKNVIWFVVDQMQGMAMGVNGDPNVFTPNLDNMAIGGTNFNRAVSGYPLCCPFRATMLTGLYANNHSVKLHQDRLDPSYRTVTDVLKDNHYETIYLGKWHLGGFIEGEVRSDGETRAATAVIPKEDRGRFDTWLGYENNNSQWDCFLHGHEDGKEIAPYRLPGYETDCLTDMALERIEARSEAKDPFFMVVSVQPPHWPNLAPPENRRYQAQQLTLRPNVPGNMEENARFGKCVPYEESVRIPFIIGGGKPMSYEGWKAGNSDCPVNYVDIAPTTLGLCGIETPDWMEGFDYSHRRTGRDFETRVKLEPDSAYLQLIGDRESGYAWRCLVTRDGWKYACVEEGDWLLYNLNEDPYEQTNLAFHTGFREKRKEMNREIRQWAHKTGDDFIFPR